LRKPVFHSRLHGGGSDGEALLPVRISAGIKPGELFATFHTPQVFVNSVTGPYRDGYVDTLEYKVTAVRIEKV